MPRVLACPIQHPFHRYSSFASAIAFALPVSSVSSSVGNSQLAPLYTCRNRVGTAKTRFSACDRTAVVGLTPYRYHSSLFSSTGESNSLIPSQKMPPFTVSTSTTSAQVYRLPTNAIPTHYQISVKPDLTKFTFAGTEFVDIDITEPTNKIQLNSIELNIHQVTFGKANDVKTPQSIEFNEADETVLFTFENEFEVGKYTLYIEFTGTLNEDMRGFYRSKYPKSDGNQERYLACTQFEATDARRAFPCWDEPALKATFDVELIVPRALVALSNMPIKSKKVDGDYATYCYEKTPKMSTYLLAFVVGELESIETTVENTLIRVFTTPGLVEQGRFSLDIAARVLPLYNKAFQIPYPLPKLDLVAIPDFSAGAMENFGLTTYRTTALLVDPANSSAQAKQRIAVTVVHEISHQWFGNLCTMEWWQDLWLNEAFATWCESHFTNLLFPEWDMWNQFVYHEVNGALALDGLESSHPVEVEVERAQDIDEIFDAISYSKGSVVVRILENWLGTEVFLQGISNYLKKYLYTNARTEQLWEVLEQSSEKPVRDMMTCWTLQTGFPVLTLSETKKSSNSYTFKVEQRHFLANGKQGTEASTWFVPVAFLVEGKSCAQSEQILKSKEGELVLTVDENSDDLGWYKINAGQSGLYRVIYPPSMLAKLRTAIINRDPNLTATDRLGVIGDAFALARSGDLATVELLKLLDAYAHETDYTVWADLTANLADFAAVLKHSPLYDRFCKFACTLFVHILESVGWEKGPNDTHLTALLRQQIIGASCKYGDSKTRQTAIRRFLSYYNAIVNKSPDASEKLSPDLRGSVYAQAARHGGELGYESILDIFQLTEFHEEKVRCLHALTAATDEHLLKRTLELALSPAVRSQDAAGIIVSVSANRKGTHLCWQFMQDNWETLVKRFGGTFSMSRLMSVIGNFSDVTVGKQIEEFISTHPPVGAERAYKQNLETLYSNATWFERDHEAIDAWLKERGY